MKHLLTLVAVAALTAGSALAQEVKVDSSGRLLAGGATDTSHATSQADDLVVGEKASATERGITVVADRYSHLRFGKDGNTSAFLKAHNISNVLYVGTNGAEAFRIDSGQRVGFGGSPSPSYRVSFQGSTPIIWVNRHTSTGAVINFAYGGAPVGSITVAGNSTSYLTSSDERLKSDIIELPNALAAIKAIKPRKYTWKSTGDVGYGFIAQELKDIVPDAVHVPKDLDTQFMSVDYSKVTPYLVGAVKELAAEVEAKDKKIASLEARLARIEAFLKNK